MQLIDVNDTITELKTLPEQERLEYMGVYDLLKSMPTIDAEPVVHGHWIVKSDIAEMQLICNCCGYSYIEADPDCDERHDYCPTVEQKWMRRLNNAKV